MFEKRKRTIALHQLLDYFEREKHKIWSSIPDRPHADRAHTSHWMPELYSQNDLYDRVLLTLDELRHNSDFHKKAGAKLFGVKRFTKYSLQLCRYIAHQKWLAENLATPDLETAARCQETLKLISREMNALRYEHRLSYDPNFFVPDEETSTEAGVTFFEKERPELVSVSMEAMAADDDALDVPGFLKDDIQPSPSA